MSVERIENGVKLSEMYTHSDYTLEQRKNVYGHTPVMLSRAYRVKTPANPLRKTNYIKRIKLPFKISMFSKQRVCMVFTISTFGDKYRTLREMANTSADKIYADYMSEIDDDF